ncbi:IS3 family transposase [Streptomyces sp. NPDC059169]|uniref:IS3 family transposase n=1 Tax=Streptomyces sp. NPDC059169 TaxID=3346754 RepID=UPI00368C19D7
MPGPEGCPLVLAPRGVTARPPAAREADDDALGHEITVLHTASRHTYGVPRSHAELRLLRRRVNRKRIARVMRERDVRGVTRRKRRSSTRPAAKARPAPEHALGLIADRGRSSRDHVNRHLGRPRE